LDFDAKPLTVSDPGGGYIYDEEGIDREKLAFLRELKNVRWGSLEEYKKKYPHAVYCDYNPGQSPWHHKADIAFPCEDGYGSEISGKEAQLLVNNG
jgi:glutamate dehydrogenase (NADP+)